MTPRAKKPATEPAAEPKAAAGAAKPRAAAKPQVAAAARPAAAAKPKVAAGADERAARAADDTAVLALLDQLSDSLTALPETLDGAEKARRVRADATRELLASPELKKMAGQSPDIRKKLTSVGKEQDRKDAETEQSIAELREAAEGWLTSLKSLRDVGA